MSSLSCDTLSVSAGSCADDTARPVSVEHGSSSSRRRRSRRIQPGISRCDELVGGLQRRAGVRGGRPAALHVAQVGQEPAGVRRAAMDRPGMFIVDAARLICGAGLMSPARLSASVSV